MQESMTVWNRELLLASQRQGMIDFTAALQEYRERAGEMPRLSSTLFRMLYLEGLRGSPQEAQRPRNRWTIKGAHFPDHLDLSDGLVNETLPSLLFEDCTFWGGFRGDDTSFNRLAFTRCSFGLFSGKLEHAHSLSLTNTRLTGDLYLEKLSTERPDGRLCIYASGLQTGGNVTIRDTALKVEIDNRTSGDQPIDYAVDFAGARIAGDLYIEPRVSIEGGLRLRSTNIKGDLRLADLRVTDGLSDPSDSNLHGARLEHFNNANIVPRDAIDGAHLHVDGNVYFAKRGDLAAFSSHGRISFFNVYVRANMLLTGATFSAPPQTAALVLIGGMIEGDLMCFFPTRPNEKTLRVSGVTALSELTIKGSLSLYGTFTSLDAGSITVEHDTTLNIKVETYANLGGANLKGELNLYGFSFLSDYMRPRQRFDFYMRGADIGHTIFLAQSLGSESLDWRTCERLKPLCYPGYELFRINTGRGTASILLTRGQKPILLDGISLPLHNLNSQGALFLESDEAIKDYIRLFGAYVWGENGPFVIVEQAEQLPSDSFSNGDLGTIRPIVLGGQLDRRDWAYFEADLSRALGHQPTVDEWQIFRSQVHAHTTRAQASVRYGASLFSATFIVIRSTFTGEKLEGYSRGMIVMPDDHNFAELRYEKLPVYERPFVWNQTKPDYYIEGNVPDSFDYVEFTLRVPEWHSMLERRFARFQNAYIELTNVSCRTLDDADGLAWGTDIAQIELENFRYGSLGSSLRNTTPTRLSGWARLLLFFLGTRDRVPARLLVDSYRSWFFIQKRRVAWRDRLDWLQRMPYQKDIFRPQPYSHLARVLLALGDSVTARKIEERRIDLEVQHGARQLRDNFLMFPFWFLYRAVWMSFRFTFRYGLSAERATLVWCLCLLVGWGATRKLNSHGYLVQNTSTVASLVSRDSAGNLIGAFRYAEGRYLSDDLPCGAAINEFLYAADVFIPLLDLKQEARCDVRSRHQDELDPLKEWNAQTSLHHKVTHVAWALVHDYVLQAQIFKSAYAVLGWIVISLTILTYSNALRRWQDS